MAARARASALLRTHPRFAADFVTRLPSALRRGSAAEQDRWYFAFAATWPDVARDFAGVQPESARLALITQYHRARWHYINLPTYLSDADGHLQIQVPPLAESPDQPDATLNLVQALTRLSRMLCRGDAAMPQRALALSWLLHLLADLHQPLHATSLYSVGRFPLGDRGGNDVGLVGGGNLHAFWDVAGGDARVRLLDAAAPPAMTFAEIALDSRALAAATVYAPSIRAQLLSLPANAPTQVAIDADYRAQAVVTARTQLVIAGRRTAALLTALFGSSDGKCPDPLAF
jgi:S1/P1 Nuclease